MGEADRRSRFEAVALPWMGRLYGMALRLAGRSQDASDLVQESYLRAYRTFDNFVPGTNAKAWLFRILYSVFVNQYRRAQRARTVAIDDAVAEFDGLAVKSWRSQGARAAALENVVALERAVERLPDEYRATVLLVDVQGLTYEEAAAALGCPVGTVRSRLSRARRALLASFGEGARDSAEAAEVRELK